MKNLKNFRGFITGAVFMFLTMTLISTVFAAPVQRTVTAIYNNIRITIDGRELEPTDANGNPVEPFIIDGTTYLPVRAIAEAVGYDVAWDGDTNTVVLTSKENVADIPYTSGATQIGDNDWLNSPDGRIVWTANPTSVVIHSSRDCSNMRNPIETTKAEALARPNSGRPCQMCWTNRGD